MKWLRLVSVLMVVVLLLGALAACARPEPTPAAPAATEAPAPTLAPETTPVPEPTEAPAPEPAATGETFVIASDAAFPPMEYVDENKDIVGFDIDLITAIAADQGFEFEIKNTAWDGIFAGLEGGEYDAILSSVTITEDRLKVYDFSEPYINAGQAVVVRADEAAIASDADLSGKTVGAQIGTTGAFAVQEIEGATLKEYDTIDLALLDLLNRNLDAVVVDTPVAADYALASEQFAGKLKIVGEPFTDENYGLVVQKGDPNGLLPLFNAGLGNVKASGAYDEIYAKWIGGTGAAIAPGGNQAVVTDTSYSAVSCDYGGKLKSIEIVDDLTIKFTTCSPDAAFASKAAFSSLAIHPSEYLEATGGTGDLLKKPIGTGPYKLEKWVEGDQIVMTANPDYWGEKAKTDTLVFRWQTEGAARLLELQAGTVDGIDLPSPDDFPIIEADATLKLFPRPALNIFYLGLNRDIPPLDNDKVRQALAVGIDRQRIVDNFYPPGSEVASHFTPCTIPGGCAGEAWYEHDPEQAKALLAEAGYPDGFEIDLTYRDVFRPYLPEPALVAQDLQAQLKELGITANITVMESGAFLDASSAGELGMYLLGWGADYPDQTNFLDAHFGQGASKQFGAGYPDIWELLDKAGSVSDPAEREKLYSEANTLIKKYVPMVPVAHGGNADVFKADVEGAHASPLTTEIFSVMKPGDRDTMVWMQSGQPISLYCADEEDGETLRACEQINESLLAYEVGGTDVVPSLAERWESRADSTEWTFYLRPGVKFHDGSDLDAKDVLLSYALQWDAGNPLHVGREGLFNYWTYMFLQFLNAPPPAE